MVSTPPRQLLLAVMSRTKMFYFSRNLKQTTGLAFSKCITSFLCVVNGVAGLMGKSAKFIKTVFKSLTIDDFQRKFDRLTMPIPWNENVRGEHIWFNRH